MIVCRHCQGTFPVSHALRLPTSRCPRCWSFLSGPSVAGPRFRQPALLPSDLFRPALCEQCGCILAQHERLTGKLCGHPRCRQAQTKILDEQFVQQITEQLTQRCRERLPSGTSRLRLAILPTNSREITPLPTERRDEFLAGLRARMITAAARREELAAQEETPEPPSPLPLPGERALLIQACTTCRGSCCQLGDTKAYLGVETLLRFLNQHPHQSAEEAVAQYESHLPEHSYDGSCVYHSERGCGLPTELRSDTCNNFYCRGLRAFFSGEEGPTQQQGIALSLSGQEIVRAAMLDAKATQAIPMELERPLQA